MSTSSFFKTILSIGVAVFCFAVSAVAQTTHTVKQGETLFSIAQQYDVEVQQVRKWNNLEGNELSIGQTLKIESPSTEEATTHTVEPKETLFSISKQYNVQIAEIKRWNDLDGSNLSTGQKLIIYPSESANQEEESIVVDQKTQQNSYYIVKNNDSLYRIARQHDMTVEELKTLNDLTSNNIRVGQRLTVRGDPAPPPSVSESEEIPTSPQGKFVVHKISDGSVSLKEVLKKFQMDKEEFRALNPGVTDSVFRSGKKLTMLAPPSKTYNNPYVSNAEMQDLGSVSASKYSENDRATPTTSGELYNPDALTAAHSSISLGSIVFIQNQENQKGVYARINDRNSGSRIKLSSAAWQALDFSSKNPAVTIYQDQ